MLLYDLFPKVEGKFMNILVIGGTGFLGRKCVESLQVDNQITVIDICDYFFSNPEVDYRRTGLENVEEIVNIIQEKKVDIVMHFVSSLLPYSNIENYAFDLQNIYIPTLRLLEFCSDNGVKFVYISSGGAVYGNQHEIFNEHTKREPVSFYGLSKLNFENAIQYYHNNKLLDYIVIRPSNPYGPGQNIHGKQGLIAVIIGKIFNKQSIEIWGNGSAVKDYIYIDDFVAYVSELIANKAAWNEIYNIGSGVGSSVKDVFMAFEANGITLPPINYVDEKKTDVKRMMLDCTKIQQISTFHCLSLQEGISKFFAEEKTKTGVTN